MWSTLGRVGLSYSKLPHLHQSMHSVRPALNTSCRSGELVISELCDPRTSISLTFLPKFRSITALGLWMRSQWLAVLRFHSVGSWRIYIGQETLTWASQKRGTGRIRQLTVKGYSNNITQWATIKTPHYPCVQEMLGNETQNDRINNRINNPKFSFIPSLVMEQVTLHWVRGHFTKYSALSEMQVHSLPRANLLQSITLPPQINWQLNHPECATPSPSLPGWGQRAVHGTKPTQGIAVYHPALMECYLPGSPHP